MIKLIGSKDLAKMLGISLRTLDSLDKNHQLPPGIRVGRTRRWRISDVENWIDAKLEEDSGHLDPKRK